MGALADGAVGGAAAPGGDGPVEGHGEVGQIRRHHVHSATVQLRDDVEAVVGGQPLAAVDLRAIIFVPWLQPVEGRGEDGAGVDLLLVLLRAVADGLDGVVQQRRGRIDGGGSREEEGEEGEHQHQKGGGGKQEAKHWSDAIGGHHLLVASRLVKMNLRIKDGKSIGAKCHRWYLSQDSHCVFAF